MTYAIKGNRKLCSFYPNDLPITGKRTFNERTGKLENIFTPKNIFVLDNSSYYSFETEDKAANFISYMQEEIKGNQARYEEILQGSTEQLINYLLKFKIVEEV
jgi:hypothetical protein